MAVIKRTVVCECGSDRYTEEREFFGDEFANAWVCTNCCAVTRRQTRKPVAGKITPSQERSMAAIRQHLKDMKLTKFEITTTTYGTVWVNVIADDPTAPEGTILHCVAREYWHFSIGSKGAITAVSYPSSCDQFKGKTVYGFTFE